MVTSNCGFEVVTQRMLEGSWENSIKENQNDKNNGNDTTGK